MSVDSLAVEIAAINRASGELQKVARDINRLDRQAGLTGGIGRFNQAMGSTIKTAAGVGLGIVGVNVGLGALTAGFRGTVGAAIDFESSFAGIRKTMNASEAEFAALEKANRNLAKSIPVSVNEINRIGELAGQLGVSGVSNVRKFEETIAKLAVTTDLSADAAATSFAQIANIVKLPINDIDRLGSVIVALGNAGASTETQIVDFTQRIAGAGQIAGLTVGEIAAIASAFSSLGIEAEAGGTATQKVLLDLNTAVTTGNDNLAIFAETAGMSIEEFKNADPIVRFTEFIEGLGKAGDNAILILDELGLSDQRLVRAFLSGAQNSQLFTDALKLQAEAWSENTALQDEAAKRFDTTAAKIQLAKNNFSDLGITLGQAVLPAIVSVSDAAVRFGPAMAGSIEIAGYGIAGLAGAVTGLTSTLSGATQAAYTLAPAAIAAGAAFAWLFPGAAIFSGLALLAAGFYTAKQDSAELGDLALDFKIAWLSALLEVGEALKSLTSFAADVLGPLAKIPGRLGDIGRAAQEAYDITRERRNDLYLDIEAAKAERDRRGQSGFYDQHGNAIELAPPGTYDVPVPPGYTPQSMAPTMTPTWAGGGGAPAIDTASQQLADMTAQINAAGQSAAEYQARLELAQEAQGAAGASLAGVSDDATRAAVDLTKLSIVLGEAGITGEAFIAQQGLIKLNEAFVQSGLTAEQFRLRILGITDQMQAAAAEINKRTRLPGIAASSGAEGIVVNGTRVTVGGANSVEGWKKVWDRIARDFGADAAKSLQEQIIKQGSISAHDAGLDYVNALRKAQGKAPIGADQYNPKKDLPRGPGSTNHTYNAPITNNYYEDSRERREVSAGLR